MESNCFFKRKWGIFYAITFLLFNQCLSQQPGGVEGTKLWLFTVKKSNGFYLADTSGNNYSFPKNSTSRNINFHPAYFVTSTTKLFDNFSFNQSTVIGAFFPKESPSEIQKYFEETSLRKTISFRNNAIVVGNTNVPRYSFGNSQSRTTLSVDGVTKQENAMKTGTYYYASNKTYNSIWGEDKQTEFTIDFDGYLPELIIYNRVLTSLEKAKVESYLSIKYGTTLDTSYIGRNGNMLWNIQDPIIRNFHNRVCAIGKDSLAGLFQPKSNTTYEERFGSSTSYNKDANDSTISLNWPYIPKNEEPSLYRSVTIGFSDKSLSSLKEGEFIFWGDNRLSIDSNQFKIRYPTQYPSLKTVQRQWLVFNPFKLKQGLRLVISGGDYQAKTLFNTIYDPYDYQLYRFVIIKINNDNSSIIGKPILCSYFGREQNSSSSRFNTRAIIWDSILLNQGSGYHYITFGKVPVLNFLILQNKFDNTLKSLEYPYYKDSAIKADTNFDTTVLAFKYTGVDSTLKFWFKTSVGVGNLIAKIYLLPTNGDKISLPSNYISNNQTVVDSTGADLQPVINEDSTFQIKSPDEDNPSSLVVSPKPPIKYIRRRVPANKQKFKEFQVSIPLKKSLNLESRFLIEVTDDLGQRTTLPIKIKKLI